MRRMLVCGGGGFIGNHLVSDLKAQGYWVEAADLKLPEFDSTAADRFHVVDLTVKEDVINLITGEFDTVYQLAADMGGAAYIFSGDNDADIMHNSAQINLNVLDAMVYNGVKRVFYSSSACVYPAHIQEDSHNVSLKEHAAYPAAPDSEYGWEKLFSERLYQSYRRCHSIDAKIARFHNVFGPGGAWCGGREKAPAALCRKVAQAVDGGTIEVWGPGTQTRSFLYITECLEGIHRLMSSNHSEPLNIGSARMISINDLVYTIAKIAGKIIHIKNVPGPRGVMARTSDNTLIQTVLGWQPPDSLEQGLSELYRWICQQIKTTNAS